MLAVSMGEDFGLGYAAASTVVAPKMGEADIERAGSEPAP